jgi:hypothetical protein
MGSEIDTVGDDVRPLRVKIRRGPPIPIGGNGGISPKGDVSKGKAMFDGTNLPAEVLLSRKVICAVHSTRVSRGRDRTFS